MIVEKIKNYASVVTVQIERESQKAVISNIIDEETVEVVYEKRRGIFL